MDMTKYYVKEDNPYRMINMVAKFRRANKRLVRKATEYKPGLPGSHGGRVVIDLVEDEAKREYKEDWEV
jgi:hypothetical protein